MRVGRGLTVFGGWPETSNNTERLKGGRTYLKPDLEVELTSLYPSRGDERDEEI
jgi:hypothetical protein